jgi:hypothetical protein
MNKNRLLSFIGFCAGLVLALLFFFLIKQPFNYIFVIVGVIIALIFFIVFVRLGKV